MKANESIDKPTSANLPVPRQSSLVVWAVGRSLVVVVQFEPSWFEPLADHQSAERRKESPRCCCAASTTTQPQSRSRPNSNSTESRDQLTIGRRICILLLGGERSSLSPGPWFRAIGVKNLRLQDTWRPPRSIATWILFGQPARPPAPFPKPTGRPLVGAWRRTTGTLTSHSTSIGRYLAVCWTGMDVCGVRLVGH